MERRDSPVPELGGDPFAEFKKWYDLAGASGSLDFDAMTLATVSADGAPHARTVLFKGFKEGDIKFYTNYDSDKARQLEKNPRAALVFYWSAIYKQIRVEGTVKKMSRKESEEYFAGRPRDSQLGAWASNQSAAVDSLESLDAKFTELEKKFAGKEIPCPEYWGGYVFVPSKFEFWIGRTKRLHHRVCFTRQKDNSWKKTFLSP